MSASCASWTRALCHTSQAMLLAVAVGRKNETSSVRSSVMFWTCSMMRVKESRSSSRAASASVSESAMVSTLRGVRGDLSLRLGAVEHRFDVVALGVADERAVVAGWYSGHNRGACSGSTPSASAVWKKACTDSASLASKAMCTSRLGPVASPRLRHRRSRTSACPRCRSRWLHRSPSPGGNRGREEPCRRTLGIRRSCHS